MNQLVYVLLLIAIFVCTVESNGFIKSKLSQKEFKRTDYSVEYLDQPLDDLLYTIKYGQSHNNKRAGPPFNEYEVVVNINGSVVGQLVGNGFTVTGLPPGASIILCGIIDPAIPTDAALYNTTDFAVFNASGNGLFVPAESPGNAYVIVSGGDDEICGNITADGTYFPALIRSDWEDHACVNDSCGVCNGDNSTCLGCDGVPASGLVADVCGECNGTITDPNDCPTAGKESLSTLGIIIIISAIVIVIIIIAVIGGLTLTGTLSNQNPSVSSKRKAKKSIKTQYSTIQMPQIHEDEYGRKFFYSEQPSTSTSTRNVVYSSQRLD